MKCEDVQMRLQDFRDGKLSESELNEFCAHLDICDRCQSLVAAENKTADTSENTSENTAAGVSEKKNDEVLLDIEMKRALSQGDYWTPARIASYGKGFLTVVWIVLAVFLVWVYWECIYTFRSDTNETDRTVAQSGPRPTVIAPKLTPTPTNPITKQVETSSMIGSLKQIQIFVNQLNPSGQEALPQKLPQREDLLALNGFLQNEIKYKKVNFPKDLLSLLIFFEMALPADDKTIQEQIKELAEYARAEKIDEKLVQLEQYLKSQKRQINK